MSKAIKYIKRSQLHISKYDSCIRQAYNSRIYAYSWYLDTVATHWGALVLNDYEAVMPLPWRRKFGIPYIYIPAWTQQLGIFSSEKLSEKSLLEFIKSIPFRFLKRSIFFNDKNGISIPNTIWRPNYVLSLKNPYDSIYQNFSKNRKQSLNKSSSLQIVISENHKVLFPFYRNYIIDKTGTKESDLQLLNELLTICYKKQKAFVVEAKNKSNKTIGGAVFLMDNNRIYYLFSALNNEGKKKQAMSHIINYIVKEYSDNQYSIDFEGSTIPGIASFFRSFGAINTPYWFFQDYSFLR